tara:strand:- start:19 stop:396 length:378 start_codon:yes stop_codon:yes gene_type:complete
MSEKKLTFSTENLLCFLELRKAKLRTRSNLTGYTGTAQLKGATYTRMTVPKDSPRRTFTYKNVTDPDDQRWQDYWEIEALDRLWQAINDREWQEELQDFWDATNEGRVKYSHHHEHFTMTPKESA